MPPGVHGELAGMVGIEPAPCGMVTGFPLTVIRPVGRAATFFTTALPFELHSHVCPSFRAASGLSRRHYHCGGLALDVVLELRGGIEPPRRVFFMPVCMKRHVRFYAQDKEPHMCLWRKINHLRKRGGRKWEDTEKRLKKRSLIRYRC